MWGLFEGLVCKKSGSCKAIYATSKNQRLRRVSWPLHVVWAEVVRLWGHSVSSIVKKICPEKSPFDSAQFLRWLSGVKAYRVRLIDRHYTFEPGYFNDSPVSVKKRLSNCPLLFKLRILEFQNIAVLFHSTLKTIIKASCSISFNFNGNLDFHARFGGELEHHFIHDIGKLLFG